MAMCPRLSLWFKIIEMHQFNIKHYVLSTMCFLALSLLSPKSRKVSMAMQDGSPSLSVSKSSKLDRSPSMCGSGSSVAGEIKRQRGCVHVFSVSLCLFYLKNTKIDIRDTNVSVSLHIKIIKTESPKCNVGFWLFCHGVDQKTLCSFRCVLCLSLSSFSKGLKTCRQLRMFPRLSLFFKIIKSTTNMPCADLALLSRR